MGRRSVAQKKMKRQKQKLRKKISCKRRLAFTNSHEEADSASDSNDCATRYEGESTVVSVITPPMTPLDLEQC